MTDTGIEFLQQLERTIDARLADNSDGSYTAGLVAAGPKRVAQKVGEEGVELALAAVAGNKQEVISESADLLYHTIVLLRSHELSLADVVRELKSRHAARS